MVEDMLIRHARTPMTCYAMHALDVSLYFASLLVRFCRNIARIREERTEISQNRTEYSRGVDMA